MIYTVNIYNQSTKKSQVTVDFAKVLPIKVSRRCFQMKNLCFTLIASNTASINGKIIAQSQQQRLVDR